MAVINNLIYNKLQRYDAVILKKKCNFKNIEVASIVILKIHNFFKEKLTVQRILCTMYGSEMIANRNTSDLCFGI